MTIPPDFHPAHSLNAESGPSHITSPHRTHPPSIDMPPPSSTLPSRKRKLAPSQTKDSPVPSSPTASDASGDKDGEYEPVQHPPVRAAAKRAKGASNAQASSSARGGSSTSTAGRGMSREALRKANHSLIERRRREKINHALGELRDMVPGLGDAEGGKGGEFKLEVLERTVVHMKELKAHIAELESRPPKSPSGHASSSSATSTSRSKSKSASTSKAHTSPPSKAVQAPPTTTRQTESPPTPSQSPDPNETDAESNLPPAFALASRPLPPFSASPHPSPPAQTSALPQSSTPSITSLLASLPDRPQPQPSSRPAPASSQAYNPTLYLPFPTPSPTSPFLSYSNSTSASSSGPTEPSPFLAPLQGMALFGGALTLDNNILAPSPADAFSTRNSHVDPDASRRERRTSKEQEEAANLLLAFSSPDVMRPMGYMPLVVPAEAGGRVPRRGTSDSEEFVLDGGVRVSGAGGEKNKGQIHVRGKTARDILKM